MLINALALIAAFWHAVYAHVTLYVLGTHAGAGFRRVPGLPVLCPCCVPWCGGRRPPRRRSPRPGPAASSWNTNRCARGQGGGYALAPACPPPPRPRRRNSHQLPPPTSHGFAIWAQFNGSIGAAERGQSDRAAGGHHLCTLVGGFFSFVGEGREREGEGGWEGGSSCE